MGPSEILIDTLKNCLGQKGIRYKDVAKALGQSEANIKRIFSKRSMTLSVLDQICGVAGIDVFELARQAHPEKEKESSIFTLAQEKALARNEKMFALMYLLLRERSLVIIEKNYDYSKTEITQLMVKLDKLQLVKLLPDDKFKPLVSRNIRWLPDGPLNLIYRDRIKQEFMNSTFSGVHERMRFLNGPLTERSLQILNLKIDQLVAEFIEIVNLDRSEPLDQTKSIWFILGHRPWRFSVVEKYRLK